MSLKCLKQIGCSNHEQSEPGKYLKVGLIIGPAGVSFLALLRLSLCGRSSSSILIISLLQQFQSPLPQQKSVFQLLESQLELILSQRSVEEFVSLQHKIMTIQSGIPEPT